MEGLGGSLAIYLAGLIAIAALLALPVYLMSPDTHLPNPGMAAYTPPPRARLVPVPRKMDAPPIVTASDREDAAIEAALKTMAAAEPKPEPAKKPAAEIVRARRDDDEPRVRYSQQRPLFDIFGLFN